MNEEYADRVILDIEKRFEDNKILSVTDIEILLNISKDLLKSYISEKYKNY